MPNTHRLSFLVSHPARPDEDVPSQNGTMALEEGDIAMGHDPFLEHGYGSKLGNPKLWMVNTQLD